MALEMADVLSDGQYVDIDPRAVAVEPATEAHAEFMLAPYEEYALIMLVHVDSSVVDMEHHAAGPELLGGSGEGGGGDGGGGGGGGGGVGGGRGGRAGGGAGGGVTTL